MRTCQLLAMALAGLSFAAWATPSLRIMPLGDSITQGAKSENTAGYRGPLWRLCWIVDRHARHGERDGHRP